MLDTNEIYETINKVEIYLFVYVTSIVATFKIDEQ